jgi:hypothetical protein
VAWAMVVGSSLLAAVSEHAPGLFDDASQAFKAVSGAAFRWGAAGGAGLAGTGRESAVARCSC